MPFGECSGQEPRLCICFVKYLSDLLLTQCPPRFRACCCCGWRCGCGFRPIIIRRRRPPPPAASALQAPPPPLSPACACAGWPPLGLKISSLQSELSTNVAGLQPAIAAFLHEQGQQGSISEHLQYQSTKLQHWFMF
jgi:hypothetical protein